MGVTPTRRAQPLVLGIAPPFVSGANSAERLHEAPRNADRPKMDAIRQTPGDANLRLTMSWNSRQADVAPMGLADVVAAYDAPFPRPQSKGAVKGAADDRPANGRRGRPPGVRCRLRCPQPRLEADADALGRNTTSSSASHAATGSRRKSAAASHVIKGAGQGLQGGSGPYGSVR
jgi:hypothetical protein